MSNSDTRLDTGPSHMDFSGPPPMPDRPPQPLQHTATGGVVLPGVGVGYGTHAPPPQHPSHGYAASAHSGYPGAATAAQPAHRPPPPPQQQQQQNSGPQDHSPTESPTPGRPLLRGGKLLVYPPGHKCSKCGNTGYKNNDTSNPCSSDWRKYGKAYGSALAASYAGGATPAANFQKPLPALRPAASSRPPQQQHHQQQQQYRPPPPQQYRPPPPIQYAPHGVPMPQNALYVQPGDPRIGGT
jgi:hypothetical protein